jgi:hypothetical protein
LDTQRKPIRFSTETTPAAPPVHVHAVVDAEGDASLRVNGIPVAYISALSGRLYPYYVSTADRAVLEAVGITFTGSGGITMGK